jgi:hypothetical protein
LFITSNLTDLMGQQLPKCLRQIKNAPGAQ